MIAAKLSDWRNYFSGPTWEEAFTFLENLPAGSENTGKLVPLSEGSALRYCIMSYPTRGPEEGIIEAHNVNIDIQLSLTGTEAINWYERSGLTAKTDYDPEKEFILFNPPASVSGTVINSPGYFSVYYPEDAHMAQQKIGDAIEEVHKVVIKVPVALVRG